MKRRSFLYDLPYPMKKFICRVALLPPIRWFIPECHRQMMNVPLILEQQAKMALQEFKRRLATDPDLLRRFKHSRDSYQP